MRRILLIGTSAVLLLLPAAAAAGAAGAARPGFLVVRGGAGDGGIHGHPVVTVIVHGFVLGRVSPKNEARVDVYFLPGAGAPQAAGLDVSRRGVRWRGHSGVEFNGSGFRFRAIRGFYRVVIRGAGVYVFAGGHGNVRLQGSSFDKRGDGTYAVNGGARRSLPTRLLELPLGGG
jgi:hypothetical protein